MPNKRQILSALSRSLMLEIARSFELPGLTAKSKDEILDTLMGKRSILIEEILNVLKVSDLKGICRELSISAGSASKDDLISMLVSDDNERRKTAKQPEKKEPPRAAVNIIARLSQRMLAGQFPEAQW